MFIWAYMHEFISLNIYKVYFYFLQTSEVGYVPVVFQIKNTSEPFLLNPQRFRKLHLNKSAMLVSPCLYKYTSINIKTHNTM